MLAFLISLCIGMYIESVFDKKMSDPINNNQILSKMNRFKKFQDAK